MHFADLHEARLAVRTQSEKPCIRDAPILIAEEIVLQLARSGKHYGPYDPNVFPQACPVGNRNHMPAHSFSFRLLADVANCNKLS